MQRITSKRTLIRKLKPGNLLLYTVPSGEVCIIEYIKTPPDPEEVYYGYDLRPDRDSPSFLIRPCKMRIPNNNLYSKDGYLSLYVFHGFRDLIKSAPVDVIMSLGHDLARFMDMVGGDT